MKKIFLLILVFLSATTNCLADDKKPERILVVSSFHLSHVWTKAFCQEFSKKFDLPDSSRMVEYLELNSVRDRQGAFREKFAAFVPRIAAGDYAMVIGLLDDANNLIVENCKKFPPNMPVILCCYRDMPPDFKKTHPNITGFTGSYDLKQTVDFALSLYPRTSEIALICDDFTSGRQLYEQAQALLANFRRCKITLLYGGKYSTQQVLKRVSALGDNSVVIFAPWRNYSKNNYASLEQIADEMSKSISHPFFIFTDVLFGHGALGGFVTDGTAIGEQAAALSEQILDGQNVRDIPFKSIPVRCILDMDLFDRENLDRDLIPPNAVRLNEKISPLYEYPVASAIIAALAVLLVFLFLTITIVLKKFRQHSHESEDLLNEAYHKIGRLTEVQRVLLDTVSDGVIITDSNRYIVAVNSAAAQITGRHEDELAGKTFDSVCRIVSAIDNMEIESPVIKVLATGNSVKIAQDIYAINAGGKKIRISQNVSALKNAEGETSGTITVIRDTTTEFKDKNSMAIALSSLENAMELAHITCSQITAEGGISDFENGSYSENWGMANGRALSAAEWIHGDDLARFHKAWNDLFHGKSDGFKIEYRSSGARTRYFTMMAKPVPESVKTGSPVFSCAIQDITENGEYRLNQAQAKEMLESIIDLLPAYLVIKNPSDNMKIVKANRKFAEMMGRLQSDIEGKTDFELFDADSAKKHNDADSKVLIAGGTSTFTEDIQGIGGKCTVLVTKTAISASNGKKLLLAIGTDITEHERIKNQAVNSQELLRAIIDNSPVGLLLKDPDDDYRYVLWNAELGRNTNTPVSDVEGKTDWEWNAYRDRAEYFRRQDEQVMRTGRPLVLEEELPITKGGSIVYRTAKIPVRLSGGKQYLLGSFVNITESRRIAEKLENTIAKQNQFLEQEHIYNECLQIVSLIEDYNEASEKCLKVIGELCGADRCFVHCNKKGDYYTDHDVEWVRDGIEHNPKWKSVELEECPTLWRMLNSKRCCIINDFEKSPDIRGELSEYLGEAFDVKSMILYGIFDETGFFGTIGMSMVSEEKEFSEKHEKILDSCVKLFLIHHERTLRKRELERAIMIRETMFSNIDIPILLFNDSGKIVNINEAGCKNMGVSMREALELPCNTVFCHSNPPPRGCPVAKVLRTKSAASFALKCNGRDYRVEAKPIFDEHGDIIYVLESALDMTDFNASQRKLTESIEAARAGNRAKTNFIATMNHELRTPLNAVIGFSELLKDGDASENEKREFIDSIYSSGKALMSMINDILDISRLDTDRFVLNLSKTDLSILLRDITAVFKTTAAEKHIDFKLIFPAFLPELFVDAARLRQIIVNLVGNAIKFTHIGEASLTVLFEPSDKNTGVLHIEVADTGIGISDELLSKIFLPFVQDEKVRSSRAYQGSGLGLAITKKLADAMGGKIEVSTCENIGSTFTVIFKNVKYIFPENVSQKECEIHSGKRILIVDDLPMNLKVLEALLKKMGLKSVSAESGKKALELMKNEKFDVILTDIWMPDMDGVELARNIRLSGGNIPKKVFAITADADWHDAPNSKLFDGIFRKPIKSHDLASIFTTAKK